MLKNKQNSAYFSGTNIALYILKLIKQNKKMNKKLTKHDFSFLAIVSCLLVLIIAGFIF